MTNLNPNQFGSARDRLRAAPSVSPIDRSIANMQRQIASAAATFDAGPRPPSSFDEDAPQPVDDQARGFYRKDYGNERDGGMRSSHYEYKKGGGDRHSVHMGAIVHHTKPSASYSYDAVEKHHDPNPAVANHIAKRSWVPPAEKDQLRAHASGEPKLFGSSYVPGRSEVFSLFGTKEASVHAGTMLGIVARDTAIETGRTLSPPDDLSPHSSKIVKNLKGKGAVPGAAPDAVTNEYEHWTEPEWSSTTAADRIPDDEVAKGRSTMRQVLRQGRPRKARETYTQERLL